jgi:hypothetical protein
MIIIGREYRVVAECGDYSLEDLPHKESIKKMAGKLVKVIGHDGNGGESFRAYKVKDTSGNTAWAWERELE